MTSRQLPFAFTMGLVSLLAACSSTPLEPVASPAPAPAPAAVTAPAPAATPQAAPAAQALAAHLDPSHPLSRERSVYFEFDEAVIPRSGLPVIERHGQYLSREPGLKVRVEGNTDERGGSEYNLALGQRRAEAVCKALVVQGVKAEQIETVSFGKERPKVMGQDEAALAQNRRADIVYAGGR